MEFNELYQCPVIDCHIHYPHHSMLPSLIEVCDQLKFDRFNIVCTPHQHRLNLTPDALYLKAHHPERVFVFGGLNIAAYFTAPQQIGEIFANNIDALISAGCDGIKMHEGKPEVRKMLPIPKFDRDVFAPYWERAAQTQIPILFHVNDPEEFWDPARAPDWAAELDWIYGDGSFINNEEQYSEIFNVLAKSPNLKVIFAHFFFMSAQQPRLAEWLDRYPNMYIDLTPGVEMYHNFSKNIEKTRDFFLKYQDRILFGTDIGAKALLNDSEIEIELTDSQERVLLIRNFLENEGEFSLHVEPGSLLGNPVSPFRGLGLPAPVLEKIYSRNFERAVSVRPLPLNREAIVEMCNQIETLIEKQASLTLDLPGDPSSVRTVRAYFEALSD